MIGPRTEREDMRTHVTRAAEGLDRRSFTVPEILRMQDAGIISEQENFELMAFQVVDARDKPGHDDKYCWSYEAVRLELTGCAGSSLRDNTR